MYRSPDEPTLHLFFFSPVWTERPPRLITSTMAKVAVFIHGMWGTPDVWRNWRPFLEARGWQTIAPALRHHDAPPLAPPADLGTTSLGDYVADLTDTIEACRKSRS